MTSANGHWSEVVVAGHACDVYEPAKLNEHGWTVLYLHGIHVNRLTDKASFIEQFDRHGLRVIAPITQRSWWSDKICPEFDPHISAERYVLDEVVPFAERQWSVKPPAIALLGTSMGGQGALRFSFKYPDTFPVVAAISPAIDHQCRFDEGDESLMQMYAEPEAVRQDTATLHVHPLNWPRHQFFCCCPEDYRWWDSADRLRMKLYSLGIPHECDLETKGGGHGFAYYNLMAEQAVDFIADRLERERLRVD